MAIDMRLISVKDGGRFAMSWVAGTNPKALRSNFQRAHVYMVDVPEVCEHMIEVIKSKEENLSFRILFKLCFGTIHIYAEQVQNLYNATLNLLCFNTFVMKQYSRNGTRSNLTNSASKRRCFESSESIDLTSLLLESEICNSYSEEKFKFPNAMNHESEKKKLSTSTCIQIKQITIRQISWDGPQPEEEDAFGEASQDDITTLLSELSAMSTLENVESAQSSNRRKRKSSLVVTDCIPGKKINGNLSVFNDEVRCAPSTYNDDTLSELNVEFCNRLSVDRQRNFTNHTKIDISQDELISTQLSQNQPIEDQIPRLVEDLNEIYTFPKALDLVPANNITSTEISQLNTPSEPQLQRLRRKRRRSPVIVDRVTKLSKSEVDSCLENIWYNCYNYNKNEHIIPIEKISQQKVPLAKLPSRRFQSTRLLVSFTKNLKARLKQDYYKNRQLIVEEILGGEYEIYKSEFKLKPKERCKPVPKKTFEDTMIPADENNNSTLEDHVNEENFQSNEHFESNELNKDILSLKCSLDKIDPSAISFTFPNEAGNLRSEWGKEGILMKLLSAWISKDPNINMSTIIVGANRINAALAFHSLLDLAGQQYIDIVKGKANSIVSIKIGPETIRKINEKCA